MRAFFLLTYDGNRSDLQVVCDYCMGPFDYPEMRRARHLQGPAAQQMTLGRTEFSTFRLKEGIKLEGSIPPHVKLWVSKGGRRDLLANPLSWLILSERLFNIFCRYAREDMQVLDVPILKQDNDEPVDSYKVINLLRVVSAIDLERSGTTMCLGKRLPLVEQIVFDLKKIPDSVHIFRAAELLPDVIISDAVVDDMRAEGVTDGVYLIRTTSA